MKGPIREICPENEIVQVNLFKALILKSHDGRFLQFIEFVYIFKGSLKIQENTLLLRIR